MPLKKFACLESHFPFITKLKYNIWWQNRYPIALTVASTVFAIVENVNMFLRSGIRVTYYSSDYTILNGHLTSVIIYLATLVFFSLTVKRRSARDFLIGLFLFVMATFNMLVIMRNINIIFGVPGAYDVLYYVNPFYSESIRYEIDQITGEAVRMKRSAGQSMTTISAIISIVVTFLLITVDAIKAKHKRKLANVTIEKSECNPSSNDSANQL